MINHSLPVIYIIPEVIRAVFVLEYDTGMIRYKYNIKLYNTVQDGKGKERKKKK